jgi:deoxyribose-phosphate aldolase
MEEQRLAASIPLTIRNIVQMIDHSLLRPEITDAEVIDDCRRVRGYHVKTVMVRPLDVKLAMRELTGSDVLVCVVVGFPHGNNTTEVKVFEAEKAMDDGAVELDMVIPIGKFKAGDYRYVEDDVRAVVEVAHARSAIVKVILENHYLTDEEIVRACELCEKVGADFVKTSTGYAPTGATVEHVKLMRSSCSPKVGVKAAGGIRTLDQLLQFRAAGATRIGTRSTIEILEEAVKREREGILKELNV